jgi:SWI/SNF-related matrix-associated actin-dependent regulator of chromatin subfamily A member 5
MTDCRIKGNMKRYQLEGLSFLVYMHRNGLSGILGDEMGLGKTLQTISLLQWLKENEGQSKGALARPSLVVCPLSVLSSWIAELGRWAPGLKCLRFHGPAHERERLKKIATGQIDFHGNETRQQLKKRNEKLAAAGKLVINLCSDDEDGEDSCGVDVVVTTYETFASEQGWFSRAFVWRYCVLDEGHKIKNDLSKISHSLQGLGCEYRLLLTGTPLQNNMLELWSLLHW